MSPTSDRRYPTKSLRLRVCFAACRAVCFRSSAASSLLRRNSPSRALLRRARLPPALAYMYAAIATSHLSDSLIELSD